MLNIIDIFFPKPYSNMQLIKTAISIISIIGIGMNTLAFDRYDGKVNKPTASTVPIIKKAEHINIGADNSDLDLSLLLFFIILVCFALFLKVHNV